MGAGSGGLRRLLAKLALVVLAAPAVAIPSVGPLSRSLESARILAVEGAPADHFPVVLFRGAEAPECRIVYWRDVGALQGSLPVWSFLVPAQRDEACRAQVEASPRFWRAGFERSEAGSGRQAFRVTVRETDDLVNRSWYVATPEGLEPDRHQVFFGPGIALEAAVRAGLRGLLASAALGSLLWIGARLRRSQR